MKITVGVQDVTGQYIPHEYICDGYCEGYEFELATATNGSLIVMVGDNAYLIEAGEIVQAIVAGIIKENRVVEQ